MKTKIDLETWNRKEHFEFFRQFEEPFHGVAVDVECTRTYQESKSAGHSFFLSYLYKSLVAANAIRAFRLRIVDGDVYEYDKVNASPTIPRADGSFGFSYMDFDEDFERFLANATQATKAVQSSTSLFPKESNECVIHYSTLPWLKFTSLSHARHLSDADSAPKISFGKMTEVKGQRVMPMSVHVHHALVDGADVGEYVNALQRLL